MDRKLNKYLRNEEKNVNKDKEFVNEEGDQQRLASWKGRKVR